MSGQIFAHSGANTPAGPTGTQGLASTLSTGTNVSSVYWNKNDTTRQLIHGSSIVEVQSSGAGTLAFGGERIFTINNDVDVVGDLYLQLSADLPIYGGRDASTNTKVTCTGLSTSQKAYTAVGGGGATVANVGNATGAATRILAVPSAFSMYDLIDRVEILVGSVTYQTLEKEDIRVMNATELDPTAFAESANLLSPKSAVAGNTAAQRGAVDTGLGKTLPDLDIHDATAWLVIPAFTRTVNSQLAKFTQITEEGYPLAAAPFQHLKIKVRFRDPYPTELTTAPINATSTELTEHIADAVDIALTETAGIKNDRFNINEAVPYEVQSNNFVASSSGGAFNVPSFTLSRTGTPAIKTCRLFAKHMVMDEPEVQEMTTMTWGLNNRIKMTQNVTHTSITSGSNTQTIELDSFALFASHLIITGNVGADVGLQSAELKLNSISFGSGALPAALLDAAATDSMGLYANKYMFAGDNVIPEGVTAHSANDTPVKGTIREFRSHGGIGTFVFPLASRAYGGSSVALDQFSTVRLTLKFTGPAVSSANSYISVTCVGSTTVTFNNNVATIAMA